MVSEQLCLNTDGAVLGNSVAKISPLGGEGCGLLLYWRTGNPHSLCIRELRCHWETNLQKYASEVYAYDFNEVSFILFFGYGRVTLTRDIPENVVQTEAGGPGRFERLRQRMADAMAGLAPRVGARIGQAAGSEGGRWLEENIEGLAPLPSEMGQELGTSIGERAGIAAGRLVGQVSQSAAERLDRYWEAVRSGQARARAAPLPPTQRGRSQARDPDATIPSPTPTHRRSRSATPPPAAPQQPSTPTTAAPATPMPVPTTAEQLSNDPRCHVMMSQMDADLMQAEILSVWENQELTGVDFSCLR